MIDFTKPVQTKGGKAVRILCTDGPDKYYPVYGIIKGFEGVYQWTKEGHFRVDEDNTSNDLENIHEEVWVRVYKTNSNKGYYVSNTTYASKEAADSRKTAADYSHAVRIDK